MSRIDYDSSVIWIPQKTSPALRASYKQNLLAQQQKSTSPGISDTTFFARCYLQLLIFLLNISQACSIFFFFCHLNMLSTDQQSFQFSFFFPIGYHDIIDMFYAMSTFLLLNGVSIWGDNFKLSAIFWFSNFSWMLTNWRKLFSQMLNTQKNPNL